MSIMTGAKTERTNGDRTERREFVIVLQAKRREDGSFFVTAPRYPHFSVVGETEQQAWDLAIDVLTEYLKLNRNIDAELRYIDELDVSDEAEVIEIIPAHVIASLPNAPLYTDT